MNQEDINVENGLPATLAAAIFHTIVTTLILTFEDKTTAVIYLILLLFTTLLLNYAVFPSFFNSKKTTIITRLFMAILNIGVAYLLVLAGFCVKLIASVFEKIEGVNYKVGLDLYESTKHADDLFTKPEANDSVSTAFYYLQSQLTAVLDFGIVPFTIISIIALMLIEIGAYHALKACIPKAPLKKPLKSPFNRTY